MTQKDCQIHDIPTMSEGREKLTNLTIKQQIKLWLKRRFTPEMKRKLKKYTDRFIKPDLNEEVIPHTAGSSSAFALPVLSASHDSVQEQPAGFASPVLSASHNSVREQPAGLAHPAPVVTQQTTGLLLGEPLQPPRPKTRFQAGDLVRIRPFAAIKESLNTWGELKGCGFMDEMEPYCGTVQRVMKPVTRFVDERDYQVKKTRGLYLLEGLMCQGTKVYGRCDRSCFFFWREEWLEPYEEALDDSATRG